MTKYADDSDGCWEARLCKFVKLYPKFNRAINIIHDAWLDVEKEGYCDKHHELKALRDFEDGIRAYRDGVAWTQQILDDLGMTAHTFDSDGIFVDEEILEKTFRLENTADNYDEMTEK